MPNLLIFTAPIPVPNLTRAKVARVTELDEDNKRVVVEVQLGATGGVLHPLVFRLEILNGLCGGVGLHPAPSTIVDVAIPIVLGGPSVATAFDTFLAAYQGAGSDKRGNVLNALKAITGTVVGGGPLNGTTQPALPAGTVS